MKYIYLGESHTLKEWAEILSIPLFTLQKRMYREKQKPVEQRRPIEDIFSSFNLNSKLYLYKGQYYTQTQYAALLHITPRALRYKEKQGKLRQKKMITWGNEDMTLKEFSDFFNIPISTLYRELKKGKSAVEILNDRL